ncbi:MAG: hypothetical protein P1V51_24645 [Deltaproteobacteria bacterium]|nr:hypothetical protein [Deltaproteobacteria bacterium]
MSTPPPPAGGGRLRALLHEWFVQYNPLYFASALCVMAGVLLLSQAFAPTGPGYGEVGLAVVLELYQWLLIGAAALLYRRREEGRDQRRPAVILGIMAMVFLGDPTFQIERMALLGGAGLLPAGLWVASVLLKLRALVWVFRLRVSVSFLAVTTLGAAALAFLPQLESFGREVLAAGMTTALFGVGAALVLSRPRIEADEALSEWGATVLRRSRKAAAWVWLGLAVYHLGVWSLSLGPSVLPSFFGAGMLVAALRKRRELSIWARVAGALGLALLGDPGLFPLVLALAAGTTLYLGWRRSPRMLVVTAFFTYLVATLLLGRLGLMTHLPWAALGVVLVLAGLLWRHRAWSAIPAALLLGLDLGVRMGFLRQPEGTLEWGGLLVLGGFLFLASGLALNLWSPAIVVPERPQGPGSGPPPGPPGGPRQVRPPLRVI